LTDDLADLIGRVLAGRAAARKFLLPSPPPPRKPPDGRQFAAVLFVDIVDSTGILAGIGDTAWGDLLEQYYGGLEGRLLSSGGTEIDRAGDGLLATFPMASTAVTFGIGVTEFAQTVGLHLHVGCHAGEITRKGATISGTAIHIASRVSGEADPDEVLVTSTVRELALGSGLQFTDRGTHSLKGFPEGWRLYAAYSP
jgi:class 3 adenylate cyclase